MTKWLKYTIPAALLVFAAVAVAAPVLLPRAINSTDRVPVVNTGTATAYTVSPDQIKAYVFNNNTTAPGVYTFNGRDGAVTPQAGDYTAAQVGADPSGSASSAVASHNAAYNHLNIPTNQQIGAMTGTSGTPSTTNAFVTNSDPRNSNARTPTAHAASHAANGSDPATLSTSQVQGLDAALAGKQPTMSNAATLGKITESGSLPLWNGGAWPGGSGGGDMYKATYDPNNHGVDAFARDNHTGTQPANTITGLAPSATTDTTTTANIAPSTDKRFVTDAQQSVLINTSGVNSGNVTIGTANGLSLSGQQLSLQLATNAQAGALSAADHTNYSQAASLAATAAQVSDSFTFKTTDTLLYGKAAGFDSTGVLGAAPDATSSAKGVVTVSGNTTVAASVSGTKTANKQLAFDASGNVIASSYDVGAAGGGGSGTVGSGTQYHLPFYSATGTTLGDSGVTVSSNGTTLTTVQGTSPDALTLRPGSANGTNGVTLLGPSGTTTAYSLQFPTSGPTAGQIPIFGTPASGIVPVTWGANGTGTYAPIDNPTFTTGITTPQITINSADGTHVVNAYNTADPATCTKGDINTSGTPATVKVCTATNTWATVTGGATLLSALTDTAISTPLTNQVLQYNGTKWVNATVATGGGVGTSDTVTALSTDSTITHGAAYVVTSAATLAFRNHSSGSYRVYAEAVTKLKPDASASQFRWVHPASFARYSTSKGYSVTLAANSYATVISDGSGVFRIKADQPLTKTGVNEYAGIGPVVADNITGQTSDATASIANDAGKGQSFQVSTTGTIGSIYVDLTSGGGSGNVTLRWGTNPNLTTYTDEVTIALSGADVISPRQFVLPSHAAVTAGTTYYFGVRADSGYSGTPYVGRTSASTYASGHAYYGGFNDWSYWVDDSPKDLMFKVTIQ